VPSIDLRKAIFGRKDFGKARAKADRAMALLWTPRFTT
jgi:hypothetical protein